jgi:Tfp pilus assembly protein PilZ
MTSKKKYSDQGGKLHKPKEVLKQDKERRKYVRRMCVIRNPIVVTYDDSQSEYDDQEKVSGYILDMTLVGLGICTNLKLPLGKTVTLNIQGSDYNWQIKGRVVWCMPFPTSNHVIKDAGPINWRIGLDLSNQDEIQAKIMENMLLSFTKDPQDLIAIKKTESENQTTKDNQNQTTQDNQVQNELDNQNQTENKE